VQGKPGLSQIEWPLIPALFNNYEEKCKAVNESSLISHGQSEQGIFAG